MLQCKSLIAITGGLAIGLMMTAPAQAVPLVFSGSGANTTTAFNAFRAAIGGGSRINWDGVRLDGTDANPNTRVIDPGKTVEIPVDRFRNLGAIYEDPYAVSGDSFASVNPETAGQFPPFTPNNTFAMFDFDSGQFTDRFIEQSFVLPNTNIAAGTRGFGAIFVDVEDATSSSIEYFGQSADGHEISLGKFAVPTGGSGESQFLGVLFDQPVITNVTLTLGTHALFNNDGASTQFQSFGGEDLAAGIDLVVTDDFVFATPTQVVNVPEPSTMLLLLGGLFCVQSRFRGCKPQSDKIPSA